MLCAKIKSNVLLVCLKKKKNYQNQYKLELDFKTINEVQSAKYETGSYFQLTAITLLSDSYWSS